MARREALWAGGQRGVIPPLGVFSLPEAGKGRLGGILEIDVVTILRLLIIPCSPLIEKERIL
jgi:hypothetical protein